MGPTSDSLTGVGLPPPRFAAAIAAALSICTGRKLVPMALPHAYEPRCSLLELRKRTEDGLPVCVGRISPAQQLRKGSSPRSAGRPPEKGRRDSRLA